MSTYEYSLRKAREESEVRRKISPNLQRLHVCMRELVDAQMCLDGDPTDENRFWVADVKLRLAGAAVAFVLEQSGTKVVRDKPAPQPNTKH